MDFHHSPSDLGKIDQIVSQFLLKILHIVLESRIPSLKPPDGSSCPSSPSYSRMKKSDKWFNLALGDRPSALENLHFWQRSSMDPMVIDIIGVRQQNEAQASSGFCALQGGSKGAGAGAETVIERWVVQYESSKALLPSQASDYYLSYKKMYKKSIILLRSVHSMMKLLPAYKIFRHLRSLSQTSDCDLIYKVSSFCAPFSSEEEQSMKHYNFSPIEEANGRLCISVTYKTVLSEFNLENSTTFPPTIITDYVGSPNTDPVRHFRPTGKNHCSTSYLFRDMRSPPSHPVQRPHSWSSGAMVYEQNQPLSGSPPAHHGTFVAKEYTPSAKVTRAQRIQSHRLSFPNHHHKNNSCDEYQLSPPFSPSSSPSTPAYLLNYSPSQSRLRAESAPVAIPHQMANRSSKYLSTNLSDQIRYSLPPLSPKGTKLDSSLSDSPSTPGLRSSRRLEVLRLGQPYSGSLHLASGQKVSKDNRDDSGRYSGLLSSGSSPRVGFSRSSSRKSFQDDLDECDFSCPFDVDDVDTSDSQSSSSLEARKGLEFNYALSIGRKSQDAAVGALVQMLRSAPPLRQDSSVYSPHSLNAEQQVCGQESSVAMDSALFLARKTSDALEELRSFREIKDMLLSKSGLATTMAQVGSSKESF